MALITCDECQKEHSDTIDDCPHCGYRRKDHLVQNPEPGVEKDENVHKDGNNRGLKVLGILFLIAMVVYGISNRTDSKSVSKNSIKPKSSPTTTVDTKSYRYVHKTVNMRKGPSTNDEIVKTLKRGEKLELISSGDSWSQVKTTIGTPIEGFIYNDLLKYGELPKIQIESWSWRTDPDFGTRGTIIWVVELRNNTRAYIKSVKVEISIYDANSQLTESSFTYVTGLSPNGTASKKSYATYYGTEKTASIRVVDWY
ncbi:MAG: hypothetical protein CMB80_12690 [Flammeovirgaceae bacterium]|nr:hypothetical protein [Flammeovirgaceae bacterium]MBE62555.1 hypothetical protein [Flammeovirgaceae bacterium]|tara:strand:+ start:1755 stop:2519 length:765 start_codon:yes stop_codon:yes gene_type:complete